MQMPYPSSRSGSLMRIVMGHPGLNPEPQVDCEAVYQSFAISQLELHINAAQYG